jgi:ketopantoate reductase
VGEAKGRLYAVRSRGGEIGFGPLSDDDVGRTPAEDLVSGRGPFKWHTQAAWATRRKWLYNTVINSLTAAKRMARNGDLLADLPTLAAVFDEAFKLGESRWQRWPLPRAELYAGLVALIEATADNENSMARDVRLGRRTETEYLAGLAPASGYPMLNSLHQTILSRFSATATIQSH